MRRISLRIVLYALGCTALFIFMVSPQHQRFIKVVTGITPSGFSDGIGTVVSKSEDCNIGVKSVTGDGKELMLELDDEDCSSVINDKVEFIYESDNPQHGYLAELSPSQIKAIKSAAFEGIFLLLLVFFLRMKYKKRELQINNGS
jgi:hypothetical protein